MRTKTLALSALLGMLGTASLVAQTNVYSLNAVGYINLSLPAGFSMIACQLITSNNTIGSLLNDVTGIYDGCKIYKWNNATKAYAEDVGDSQLNFGSGNATNGWDNNGTITMNPGEAVWINAATALSITFVGTVPQGTNTVPLNAGFTMASSPVPFSGDIVTNMGLTNYNDADKVYVWNNPSGTNFPKGAYTEAVVDLFGGSQGYMSQWDTPDPVANVGQGFWYNSTASFNWTQVFSVNP